MLIYGLIPFQLAVYHEVAYRSIPIVSPSGDFVSPDQAQTIFTNEYAGTAPLDKVICDPSANGYDCYGYEFAGYGTFYNSSLQYYGAVMLAAGGISAYVGNRFEPLKPREKLTRPIHIRIDENICIANTVCVQLAPKVFQLKKQDRATIFAPLAYIIDPNGATNDEILIAAQMCPTGAIIIEDAQTGERIHPPLPET